MGRRPHHVLHGAASAPSTRGPEPARSGGGGDGFRAMEEGEESGERAAGGAATTRWRQRPPARPGAPTTRWRQRSPALEPLETPPQDGGSALLPRAAPLIEVGALGLGP